MEPCKFHRKTLLLIEDKNLHTILKEHIDEVLKDAQGQTPHRILDLEKERLFEIMVNWLSLEKQRPSFEVVATEFSFPAEINGLPVQLQVDRIGQNR